MHAAERQLLRAMVRIPSSTKAHAICCIPALLCHPTEAFYKAFKVDSDPSQGTRSRQSLTRGFPGGGSGSPSPYTATPRSGTPDRAIARPSDQEVAAAVEGFQRILRRPGEGSSPGGGAGLMHRRRKQCMCAQHAWARGMCARLPGQSDGQAAGSLPPMGDVCGRKLACLIPTEPEYIL